MPKPEISIEGITGQSEGDRALGREITKRYKRPENSETPVNRGGPVPKRNRLDEMDGDTGDKDYEITGEA